MINNLSGGLADKAAPSDFKPHELALGVQVEMEHTNDPAVAQEIAMDHLIEDPEYYTKLVKAGLAKEFSPTATSALGDKNHAINDKSRAGHKNNVSPNMGGKMGNTSNGQVHGRNSEPIINKTIDIDLEEAKKKKRPKPTNPSLWARAKSAARSKFDVYPSAYANAWAAKWYKSKGGGWRMSEDAESSPARADDGPFPSQVSPDGQGTYGSGYDYVGFPENYTNMKKQQLKEIIKKIIRESLDEQDELSQTNAPMDQPTPEPSADLPAADSEEDATVTLTLDKETAQKIHDMLMQQLQSAGETETSEESPEPSASPAGEESDDQQNVDEAKKWIQKAIKHPGALHKQLGVPASEKIPAGKLAAAAKKGGKLGKRARLAQTLKKIGKK